MIDTIGKNHGHYQNEQNMVIVKKKTYGKKKRKRTPNKIKKNETERRKVKLRKYFGRRKALHTILLTKIREKFKIIIWT